MSQTPVDGASPVNHPDVTPAWQAWIAENLLRGVTPQVVAEQMGANGGFPASTAEREVVAALNHPYLIAASQLGVNGQAADPNAKNSSARAEKYAWWMETQRRTAKLSTRHGTIPRVKQLSPDAFLEEFYAPNLPCVIEGAIDDWPALTKWDPAYLKAKCGDQTVEVQANRTSADTNILNVDQTMKFGDFVDIVERGEKTDDWYMTANNDPGNRDALAALWDDIRLPDYLSQSDSDPIGGGFLWYGPAGTLSATHHDLTNNLMAQVIGRKRVKIVAPNESAHMYNHHNRYSLVNLEEPDFEAYPDAKGITILDTEIGPGDLLFLPVGWWHSVRALDVSFTFTFTNFIWGDNDFYSFYNSDRFLDEK